ncbi:MAG TPA: helix-turn-helix domain-containing protein [Cyclobacteriaceae bacterium]|nr:helix-turn-helix domain-containing protein [Cyclobacteriaceae bacterium]HRJ81693.1 helix-turn-helix domain-containing protein [Cyclobacteriaceae bacterium]
MSANLQNDEDIFSMGYAILPIKVIFDTSLTPFAKLLYSYISCLCVERGYCWASNKHLSEKLGVSEKTISRGLNELAKHLRFEQRTSKKRKIFVNQSNRATWTKMSKNPDKNVPVNMDKNVPQNNISINSKKIIVRESADFDLKVNLLHDYFNELRKDYGHETLSLTESRITLYKKLLSLEFSFEDLQLIARYRFNQLSGDNYRQYQVPEKVFREKDLQSYFDEAKAWENPNIMSRLYTIA